MLFIIYNLIYHTAEFVLELGAGFLQVLLTVALMWAYCAIGRRVGWLK